MNEQYEGLNANAQDNSDQMLLHEAVSRNAVEMLL